MKNIIGLILMVIGFVIGCGDEGSTTVIIQNSGTGGNVGAESSGGNSNVGGSTITLDTVIINSSGGSTSKTGTISNGGSSSSGGATSCTPKTCNEMAQVMAVASKAHNGLGDLVDWDALSITACGEVSDGCGGVLNCITPNCTSCGTVNNLNPIYPVVAIAGICASTMCFNYPIYSANLCIGDSAGKELWFCNPGDAVGPRTKAGCVSIPNPNKSDAQTAFCCSG